MYKHFFYYDRNKYENFLEDRESKVGKFGNFVLDLFVVISIVVIILETINTLPILYKEELFLANLIISSVFFLDYLYRFFRAKDKFIFLSSVLNIIDLMSFLPFFLSLVLSFFIYGDILKIFRIMRVFRVLRLIRNIPLTFGFVKALKTYGDEYKAVFLLFSIIIFVVSVLVYEIESPINPKFSSVGSSLWWGVVTAATVGYGDIVPITTAGKIIGSIVILLGPALLSVVGAITILVFTDVARTQEKLKKGKTKICAYCERENIAEANYCINCGKRFKLIKKDI
ncbi:MAG: ion transporter [Candidatus Gracilibacteria bacterium]|nr:ion transporter [Candidatus Gracilibacteria bacterium]